MITGIVIALSEEVGTLTSKRLQKGRIDSLNEHTWMIYSGAGEENARIASESLVNHGVDRLISWGCAAALHDRVRTGHLVLAESCVDSEQTDVEFDNREWNGHVKSHFDSHITVHVGRLAASKRIVDSANDKLELGRQTGAIALDMESMAIAKVASSNGIPFMTIRVVADSLDMNLPKAVRYALNEEGDVELAKLLRYLTTHPYELPDLIKLGAAFSSAKKTLRRIAKDIEVVTRYGRAQISTS